jgi:hypothetical protein
MVAREKRPSINREADEIREKILRKNNKKEDQREPVSLRKL